MNSALNGFKLQFVLQTKSLTFWYPAVSAAPGIQFYQIFLHDRRSVKVRRWCACCRKKSRFFHSGL